jgi:hypothetical protein
MKRPEHIAIAKAIGDDLYELINYISLPANASKEDQVIALNRDSSWIRDHMETICRRINVLQKRIEEGR